MKNQFALGLMISCVLLLPLFTYLTVYYSTGFNINIYEKEFEKNNVEFEDRIDMGQKIIDYNKGKTDYLDLDLNERERKHMEDVKIVMGYVDIVYLALLAILLGGLGYLIMREKDLFKASLFYGGILTILIPLVIYLIPFDIVFDKFHTLFFESGTWIFEESDLLVRLFPLGFWYDYAVRIFGISAVSGVILVIISRIWKG